MVLLYKHKMHGNYKETLNNKVLEKVKDECAGRPIVEVLLYKHKMHGNYKETLNNKVVKKVKDECAGRPIVGLTLQTQNAWQL